MNSGIFFKMKSNKDKVFMMGVHFGAAIEYQMHCQWFFGQYCFIRTAYVYN